MRRYSLVFPTMPNGGTVGMVQSDNGEWVVWDDVKPSSEPMPTPTTNTGMDAIALLKECLDMIHGHHGRCGIPNCQCLARRVEEFFEAQQHHA